MQWLPGAIRFSQSFIRLIMDCLTTTQYSVVLNRDVLPSFSPKKRLRQGDPISPYLFVLVTEVFSALILNAKRSGALAGVSVANNAPNVTHLFFFAADSLFFGRVNVVEVEALRDIIARYGAATGQCINIDKSNMFFSANTKQEDKVQFTQILRKYMTWIGTWACRHTLEEAELWPFKTLRIMYGQQ